MGKLDLFYHADLCFNYLTKMVDPKLDFLPYWLVAIDENPAYAKHYRVDDAELVASWAEALILLRQMTGSEEGLAVENSLKRLCLRDFGKKGLRYHHKYPWTDTIFSNIHEQAYFISAFATWYDETKDKIVREKTSGLVKGLREIAQERKQINYWSGDFDQLRKSYFFPGDNYYPEKGFDLSRWTGRGEEMIRNGIIISPLLRWYEVSGDETAFDLAEGLINHIVYESRKFSYRQEYIAHVHSTMWIVSGVTKYAIIARNKELLKWARNVYEFTRSHSSSFGWVPEYIGWRDPREEYCETCCIKDMIECAGLLISAGYEEYWEDIDRFARNHLVESQLKSGEFIKVNNSREDSDEYTYKDIDKRAIGGFSGGTEPNSLSISRFRSLAGCCAGLAPQAFFFVWRDTILEKEDGVYINLGIDKKSASVELTSCYPDEGRLQITALKDCKTIFIRIPPWGGQRVALFLGNKPQPLHWKGNYLRIPDVKKGQKICLSHPLPLKKEKEVVRGQEYTVYWKGNTVMRIYPEGDPIRLYQREPVREKSDGLKIPAPTQWGGLKNL